MVSLTYSVLNNYLFVILHQVAADSGGNNSSGSTAVSAAIQADLYSTKRWVFVPVPTLKKFRFRFRLKYGTVSRP